MLESSLLVEVKNVVVKSCGVGLGGVDGSVGKGGNSFVGGAHGNLVDGARCGNNRLIVGVVEGVFEFVESVFWEVRFLCKNEVVIE